MNIYVVSSDKKETKKLKDFLMSEYPDANISSFGDSMSSLASAREDGAPDMDFLDYDMPELSGYILGTYLKEMNPFTNIILLADGREHAYDAVKLHVSGYLLKPVDGKDLQYELSDLRYSGASASKGRIFIQTFGDFEI
ncbi:MAG: response regulator, partial [Lachnospiraceae bacterium]|nr:response regulator [Lachnospiraceae bacterium]